ncbi:MAG: hypothetical protein K8R13_02460 [Methanococcoides sp.]|nr:hypothetical protein [Methanococcoides sp.]
MKVIATGFYLVSYPFLFYNRNSIIPAFNPFLHMCIESKWLITLGILLHVMCDFNADGSYFDEDFTSDIDAKIKPNLIENK